jgi:hypothetical protein
MPNAITSARSTFAALVAAETTLIAALLALLPNATFTVNGQQMTTAQVVAMLKAHLAAIGAEIQGKAQQHLVVANQKALRASCAAAAQIVESYAIGLFGKGSAQLTQLGFATTVKRVPSSETLALAAEKRRATRAARGTKGKRQKAGIHGTVTVPPTSNPTGH